jgi:putative restriction endonuclease
LIPRGERGNLWGMVGLFIAVTDYDWFQFLAAMRPDEVNFWAPSGQNNFRSIQPGELFLFKLHSPNNFIVGGGVFSHASSLPLSLAWESFGAKNRAIDLSEMHRRVGRYRSDEPTSMHRSDPVIGCRILTNPFFWPRDLWIPAPESWLRQTVIGKRYDTGEAEGLRIWNAVMERADQTLPLGTVNEARYGAPTLVRPRLGQGAFRVVVTDAYERRCAVSGERTLPILDAAHIRSYADGGEHEGSNGLLLRTDIHKLFDLGYVTLDEDRRFVVGRRLKEDFDNGKHYYDLHGTTIRPPRAPAAVPSVVSLTWHRENRFLG